MKLIDLDKVVSICDEDDNAVIYTNLKNAEVKAIPIEWVKKFRNQFETTDDYYNVIDYMLQLWEKENEID